ncbi:MAG: IS1634 family transposase [Clostridia bacterium]
MDSNINEIYNDGKASLIVSLCETLGIPTVFDTSLTSESGRPPEIPYGVLAMMMMVNMCDDHKPLYLLDEYYEFKDLEGIFHYPIRLDQINDDRFGGFLDRFNEAGCRKIFSDIAAKAFIRYNIKIRNINFDTTSKVMWGLYETDEEPKGVIKIDFGHSKDKREDKKQLKIGIGCAEGIVADAVVLSGNKDDKTYNSDNLDNLEEVMKRFHVSKEEFYYIADSALFSEENLKKAAAKGIKLITRMPDNTKIVAKAIEAVVDNPDILTEFTFNNAKDKERKYGIAEKVENYRSIPLKLAICYSHGLIETKQKTIAKQVEKEAEKLEKLASAISKRDFACAEDAEKEIVKLNSKEFKKLGYHSVKLCIRKEPKRRPGRPSVLISDAMVEYKYYVDTAFEKELMQIDRAIRSACCFVLCSNDIGISGTDLLVEYKTQDSVEKKFQQLKSPHFVNSIYLDSPTRVEAFAYLMLISILMLSIAEHVVRRGMKENDEIIIGPGKVKMKNPTLQAIYSVFYSVRVRVNQLSDGKIVRQLVQPLRDNVLIVLKHLGISKDTFTKGSG